MDFGIRVMQNFLSDDAICGKAIELLIYTYLPKNHFDTSVSPMSDDSFPRSKTHFRTTCWPRILLQYKTLCSGHTGQNQIKPKHRSFHSLIYSRLFGSYKEFNRDTGIDQISSVNTLLKRFVYTKTSDPPTWFTNIVKSTDEFRIENISEFLLNVFTEFA